MIAFKLKFFDSEHILTIHKAMVNYAEHLRFPIEKIGNHTQD